MRRINTSQPSCGFTLIEMMVVVALGAILLSIAFPSFSGLLARKRLEGVVAELTTDLQYARSEAVQKQASGVLSVYGAVATNAVGTTPVGTCYVVYLFNKSTSGADPACACGSTTTCDGGATELKTVTLPTGNGGVTLTPGTTVSFDPIRGLAGPGTTTLTGTSTGNASLTLSAAVASVGRVRTCVPNGSALKGYGSCS